MGYDWSICWNLNIWDMFRMNQVQMRQCHRKVISGKRVSGIIRGLQFECARVLHETFLLPLLRYGSMTLIWKEKERSLGLGFCRWTTLEDC